jgi:hypothetical protein
MLTLCFITVKPKGVPVPGMCAVMVVAHSFKNGTQGIVVTLETIYFTSHETTPQIPDFGPN